MDFQEIKKAVPLVSALERLGHKPRVVGHRAWFSCPFHDEIKPSFKVEDNRYYCFSCNEHGDLFDILRKLVSAQWTDAAAWLRREFGVSLSSSSRKVVKQGDETTQIFQARRIALDKMGKQLVQKILRIKSLSKMPPEHFEWDAYQSACEDLERFYIQVMNYFVENDLLYRNYVTFIEQALDLGDPFWLQPHIRILFRLTPGRWGECMAGLLGWDEKAQCYYVPSKRKDQSPWIDIFGYLDEEFESQGKQERA